VTDGDYTKRFGGIARLYGAEAVGYLRALHVCVVGIGGVGSWAAEALARTGIGALTLIDYDEVCPTNINRQIPALSDNIGQKKTAVMAARVQQINPDCRCQIIDDYVNMDNVREYLAPERAYGYVIDAIDSIRFKAVMIHHCRRNRIPIITTGAAGGLTDPAMLQVRDLSKTRNDPLAAKVRAKLRDEYGFSRNPKRYFGVECVFSAERQLYPGADGTVSHCKPGVHGVNLDCRLGYGSAAYVTAAAGMLAASRVVNRTLKKALSRQ
jgi:tRNA A37 threonylcarbamoyladenosine dehydratase